MPPNVSPQEVVKIVTHSRRVLNIAKSFGWLPGARYTNLRDVRDVARLGFLDINWKQYDYRRHLQACRDTLPLLTVACDIERSAQLPRVIDQAMELAQWAQNVIVVPKSRSLAHTLNEIIPSQFLLGFSVPTKYGGTRIPAKYFRRPVHLLGGRPDNQRKLAGLMPVASFDCNRFTLDAGFGDFFDGERFRPHPIGGYERCIKDSVRNISALWYLYPSATTLKGWESLEKVA